MARAFTVSQMIEVRVRGRGWTLIVLSLLDEVGVYDAAAVVERDGRRYTVGRFDLTPSVHMLELISESGQCIARQTVFE